MSFVLFVLYRYSDYIKRYAKKTIVYIDCRRHERKRRRSNDEYVTGYKYAYLSSNAQGDFFPARAKGEPYNVVSEAVCRSKGFSSKDAPHDVDDHHHCGFYAARKKWHLGWVPRSKPGLLGLQNGSTTSDVNTMVAPAILEVDLSGKVIIGTFVYRGQKMRVMRVWVANECVFEPCGRSASGGLRNMQFPAIWVPVCEQHCGDDPSQVCSLEELGQKLGTDIAWDRRRTLIPKPPPS